MNLYEVVIEWLKTQPDLNWKANSVTSDEDSPIGMYCSSCTAWVLVVHSDYVAIQFWNEALEFIEQTKLYPADPEFFKKLRTAFHPCELFQAMIEAPNFTLAS